MVRLSRQGTHDVIPRRLVSCHPGKSSSFKGFLVIRQAFISEFPVRNETFEDPLFIEKYWRHWNEALPNTEWHCRDITLNSFKSDLMFM